ncbi:MAG: glycosyltransferase [Candidatus Omnitrophica bacterium]|nr:glycosyltransferase [Candidatus Omnitrophota bacterium]
MSDFSQMTLPREEIVGQSAASPLEEVSEKRRKEVLLFCDKLADTYDDWHSKNRYYYREVESFCSDIVSKESRILEIGCGTGDLLNRIAKEDGIGIDISPRMISLASKKYPHLKLQVSDIEHLEERDPFDYVIMSHLMEFIPDLWAFLAEVKKHTHPETRLVILTTNPLWEPIMRLGAKWRLRSPETIRNFITRRDLVNILELLGYEVTSSGFRIFFPKRIPFISFWLNKILPRLPVVNNLCALQFIIAKPESTEKKVQELSCSVIVPCFNEAENIEVCVKRIPKMGIRTEVVVVDDGSTDGTGERARRIEDPEKEVQVISYSPNRGKASAVRTGIEAAGGDVLMILDADMAVMPEELPRFFKVLSEGRAEFVNGTRMVYPMASGAMKFLNFLGNKIFGIILSFIMEQRNTDTLCGTKAFFKKHFRSFVKGKDAWGDFDLLFEAARKRLKMAELPIHYTVREKGKSKMKPLRDGASILKTCFHGLKGIH